MIRYASAAPTARGEESPERRAPAIRNLRNRLKPICRDMVLQYIERVWLSDAAPGTLAPSRLWELRYRRYQMRVMHAALERLRDEHEFN